MNHQFKDLIVISLGGSVICPEEVDYRYLKDLRKYVTRWIKGGKRLIIVAGGGRVSRKYQQAASSIVRLADEDKDWIGIHATRLNAHLLRTIFRDIADPVVLDKRHRLKRLRKPVTVASGWQPGWSTDYVAAVLAYDFGAKEIVIAGRPAYVYDKDHVLHGDAAPLYTLSWKEYRKFIPAKWSPGIHAPVDPVAARFAQKEGLAAIVIGGNDLKNFDALLKGKEFQGTKIQEINESRDQ